jgi:hypothetical protein
MELREQLLARPREELLVVEPLAVPEFLLLGRPIEVIRAPGLA